ncbi:hypothetical protein BH10BAC3_BH10BAC3_41910 [soil metagenome]
MPVYNCLIFSILQLEKFVDCSFLIQQLYAIVRFVNRTSVHVKLKPEMVNLKIEIGNDVIKQKVANSYHPYRIISYNDF